MVNKNLDDLMRFLWWHSILILEYFGAFHSLGVEFDIHPACEASCEARGPFLCCIQRWNLQLLVFCQAPACVEFLSKGGNAYLGFLADPSSFSLVIFYWKEPFMTFSGTTRTNRSNKSFFLAVCQGLPFWHGRCDPRANQRRVETVTRSNQRA